MPKNSVSSPYQNLIHEKNYSPREKPEFIFDIELTSFKFRVKWCGSYDSFLLYFYLLCLSCGLLCPSYILFAHQPFWLRSNISPYEGVISPTVLEIDLHNNYLSAKSYQQWLWDLTLLSFFVFESILIVSESFISSWISPKLTLLCFLGRGGGFSNVDWEFPIFCVFDRISAMEVVTEEFFETVQYVPIEKLLMLPLISIDQWIANIKVCIEQWCPVWEYL